MIRASVREQILTAATRPPLLPDTGITDWMLIALTLSGASLIVASIVIRRRGRP